MFKRIRNWWRRRRYNSKFSRLIIKRFKRYNQQLNESAHRLETVKQVQYTLFKEIQNYRYGDIGNFERVNPIYYFNSSPNRVISS